MRNPLAVTYDFLRGNDLKVRLPEPDLERKEAPPFWPGIPPYGAGMLQRFLPGSDAVWVPAAAGYADGYGNAANSAVFACLNVIGTAFPEAPLRVYHRAGDDEPEWLPEHPLQALLTRPNPHHSVSELWYWTQFAKHTRGNAFWRKVRAGTADTGPVVELWPLSPARVEVVTTDADRRRGVFISYYRYEVDTARYEDIPPWDVVHFRLGVDDRDHRLGCSPLQRLVREVTTDDETTRFVDTLLQNYAVPGLVVTTPDRTLSREDAERIKDDVGNRFSGDQRGRVGVLNNGATVAQFGFSPEQLDMKTLHRVPEERIAAVMGVPAIVAGLGAGLDRSTYSNVREAREMFTETKLCPLWTDDAGSVNLQLLPDFDGNPEVFSRFDLTDVRALQEDEDKKYARLNLGVQGKWITVNEARADIGLPPVDGGDELPVSQPPPPAFLQQQRNPPALPPPGQPGETQQGRQGQQGQEQAALGLTEQKAAALRAFPALLDAIVELARPGLQRDLDRYWAEQHQRVLEAVIREAA